jgi:hypothetical protein
MRKKITTPANKKLQAKLHAITKKRLALFNQSTVILNKMRKQEEDHQAKELLKHKYWKQSYGAHKNCTEFIYIHSVRINKKLPLCSRIKVVRIYDNEIACCDYTLQYLVGHKSATPEEFSKTYMRVITEIISRTPVLQRKSSLYTYGLLKM